MHVLYTPANLPFVQPNDLSANQHAENPVSQAAPTHLFPGALGMYIYLLPLHYSTEQSVLGHRRRRQGQQFRELTPPTLTFLLFSPRPSHLDWQATEV